MNAMNNADELFGYTVLDSGGNKLGTVTHVWVHQGSRALSSVGIQSRWSAGKTAVVPVSEAQIDARSRTIRAPYTMQQIQAAPAWDSGSEFTREQQEQIFGYYRNPQGQAESAGRAPAGTVEREQVKIPLSEEELHVHKRQVETGQVRLRKVVHAERVEQPVKLRREHVNVAYVPVTDGQVPANAFQEEEIEVSVMAEEAVVTKTARVTSEAVVQKSVTTSVETISDTVRKEVVEVERDGIEERVSHEQTGR
jgi:uncharacterized protein (TIGR02271 family)